MKELLGKIVSFEATVGVSAPSHCRTKLMVCLEDVSTSEGVFRDHAWVERIDGVPEKGATIQFNSKVRKYFSHFEGLEQINKLGLSEIKNIKKKDK